MRCSTFSPENGKDLYTECKRLLKSPFTLNKVNLKRLSEAGVSYFQADPEICRLGEAFV